jgi:hypothetical protein
MLRYVAMVSALLAFAGAAFVSFVNEADDRSTPLAILALLSIVPTAIVGWAWVQAWRGGDTEEESPWEQHWPREGGVAPRQYNLDLVTALERADRPYDKAIEDLGFMNDAIRVASSEGGRQSFPWTVQFEKDFKRRLLDGLRETRAEGETAGDVRSLRGDRLGVADVPRR